MKGLLQYSGFQFPYKGLKVFEKGFQFPSKGFQLGSVLSKFDFATADGTITININIKFPVGKSIIVDWGDDTYTEYNGNDLTSVLVSKIYAEKGIYPIKLTGDYTSLTYLHCYNNSFTGDISSWSTLTSLIYLYCYGNSFTGDISSWSTLTSLTSLYCHGNSLTGDISSWSTLTSLTYLRCYSNSFTGDISSWSTLTSLTYLNCNSNSLTGDISSWSTLTSLNDLRCYSNSFTGDISSWSTLTSLIYLNCNSNSLTGDISSWSTLTSLTYLDCYSNSLTIIPIVPVNGIYNYNASINSISTSDIDNWLAGTNVYFAANAPTTNCTYTINGTGIGVPTGGASNSDLLAIVNSYSSAGYTATFIINT